MGTIGAFRGVMNIVSNPRLHKRYGTQGVLRLSTVGFLVTILLGPLTNLVRAHFTMPIVTGFLGFTVLSVYTQSLAYCKCVQLWLSVKKLTHLPGQSHSPLLLSMSHRHRNP